MDPSRAVSADKNKTEDHTMQEPRATTTTTTTPTAAAAASGDSNIQPANQLLEDQQEVIKLYQTSPAHLWPIFNSILQFCDAVDEEVIKYEASIDKLIPVYDIFYKLCPADVTTVGQCVVASGFVTQAVKVIRMAIGGGTVFGSRHNSCRNPKALCGRILLGMFHNFTNREDAIRIRLAKTEIFRDIVECLKMFRHISPEIVEGIGLCHNFLGILHNSCKNPDVAAAVKGADIVPHLVPYLDKSRSKNVRLSTLALLALIVDDTQLGHLELDLEMLDYSLCRSKKALESTDFPGRNGWEVEELADTLAAAARLEFNKRLIVAKEGAVELFKTVLQKGLQEDIQATLGIFAELVTDPINAKIFQRNKGLLDVLSSLQHVKDCHHSEAASKILTVIRQADAEEDNIEENTALYDVMEDESNTLDIMGVGRPEFVFDLLLTVVTSGARARDRDVTCVTELKALQELATDESSRREFLARGGLDLLKKVFKNDLHDEVLESCNLLLELACRKEYCLLMQADTELMESVQRLTRHDSQQVRQTASQLVDSVEYYIRLDN